MVSGQLGKYIYHRLEAAGVHSILPMLTQEKERERKSEVLMQCLRVLRDFQLDVGNFNQSVASTMAGFKICKTADSKCTFTITLYTRPR